MGKKISVKSPIFRAKPGWGGKIKKWLSGHFESRILPTLAYFALAIGIYFNLR